MDIGLAITVAVTVAGATWALRSKLGDIDTKLASVVEKVTGHEARIIKLEGRAKRR